MTEFKSLYSEYQNEFEKVLVKFCNSLDCKPEILRESLKYSLTIGGKRIRPVLMLACGDVLGV